MSAPPPPAPGGKVPPPPPPPKCMPPPPPPPSGTAAPAAAGGADALFAEIRSKGDGISGGLRHVSKAERSVKPVSTTVPDSVGGAVAAAAEKKAPKAALPASVSLAGNRWMLQSQCGKMGEPMVGTLGTGALSGNPGGEDEEVTRQHTVVLTQCSDMVLTIPCKVNAIQMVECTRVGVIFPGVIASVEVTRSQQVKVRAAQQLPSLVLERCDGVEVALAGDAVNCEITTCATTGVNVTVPDPRDPEEDVEVPIPEQFITTIKGKKAHTRPSEHAA